MIEELARYPEVLQAATTLPGKRQALAALCAQVQQIAAPTDAEQARAGWIAQHWQQLGLTDVLVDQQSPYGDTLGGYCNVYARIPGAKLAGRAPQSALMVSAHTDTVF